MPEQGVENGCSIYPKINIKKVFFELSDYKVPRSGYLNSPYSVEEINKGIIAWIWNDNFKMFAGTTIDTFVNTIEKNGGTVWLEKEKTRFYV